MCTFKNALGGGGDGAASSNNNSGGGGVRNTIRNSSSGKRKELECERLNSFTAVLGAVFCGSLDTFQNACAGSAVAAIHIPLRL